MLTPSSLPVGSCSLTCKACKAAWPALGTAGLPTLSLHAGLVGDPLLVEWEAAMVAGSGAVPAYSAYPAVGDPIGQQGLAAALDKYDPAGRRFVVGESTCFGCTDREQWLAYFKAIFENPFGRVLYVRIYNIEPFLAAGGALDALVRNPVSSFVLRLCM